MLKAEWNEKIKQASEAVGTYNESFDPIIDTLAEILESRDKAVEQFRETGANPVVAYTNKAKQKNYVKNPLLVMAMDLNAQALAYWRDLGLTPAGLKKLNADALNAKATAAGFEALLEKIGK